MHELLALNRTFAAPPKQVFAAFTNPKLLKQWWAPPGSRMRSAEINLQIGGSYRFGMWHPQKGEHYVGGVYREIVPYERLVFTWRWELPEMDIGASLVTIQLIPKGRYTELSLTQAKLPNKDAVFMHRQGWLGLLDSLEIFLQK